MKKSVYFVIVNDSKKEFDTNHGKLVGNLVKGFFNNDLKEIWNTNL